MGGALLGAAGTQMAVGQNTCSTTTPSTGFAGVIGRTSADSKPSPLAAAPARPGSPNIIYIVLDDTGFSDLHCYGSEVATPNIDALAAGGLRYNNFHCKAICSPSRAALLTGRNSHAVGMKELAGDDQGYPHSRGRVTPAGRHCCADSRHARLQYPGCGQVASRSRPRHEGIGGAHSLAAAERI